MRVDHYVDGVVSGSITRSDWIKIQLIEVSIGGGSVKRSWRVYVMDGRWRLQSRLRIWRTWLQSEESEKVKYTIASIYRNITYQLSISTNAEYGGFICWRLFSLLNNQRPLRLTSKSMANPASPPHPPDNCK